MSDGITHISVVDDCARLALHAPTACNALEGVLRHRLETGRPELAGQAVHDNRATKGASRSGALWAGCPHPAGGRVTGIARVPSLSAEFLDTSCSRRE